MKKIILLMFLAISTIVSAQEIFEEVPNHGMEANARGTIALVDTDGDGIPDSLVKNGFTYLNVTAPNTFATLAYDFANGTFTSKSIPFAPVNDGFIVEADLDGQYGSEFIVVGDTSILLNGTSRAPEGYIYYSDPNAADGSGYTVVPIRGLYDASISVFDKDSDGDLDFVMKGSSSPGVKEFLEFTNNAGVMVMGQIDTTSLLAISLGDSKVADTDGDGDLDILAQGVGSANVTTYLHINNGGTFTGHPNPFPQLLSGSNPMEDINGDGMPDAVISGRLSGANGGLRVTEVCINLGDTDGDGIGNNTFSSIGSLKDENGNNLGFSDSDSIFGDVDGDGDLDLFIQGDHTVFDVNGNDITTLSRQRATLYLNDGSGNFVHEYNFPEGVSQGSAVFFDADGDGDLDLYYEGLRGNSGFYTTDNYFYENKTSAPLSVDDNVIDNNITMFPNPATDILNVKMDNLSELEKIAIYNMSGQEVLMTTQNTVNVSSLASGMYVVNVQTSKGFETKKLLKK